MLRIIKANRAAAIAGLVVLSAQSIQSPQAFADGPAKAATQEVQRPALGDIDVGDYCEVLLAPKLRTHLGVSDAQREALEKMNTELKARMDNCATAVAHGPSGLTPGMISARIRLQMADFGRKVRDTLTPEQDKRLVDLFSQGALRHIEVSAVVERRTSRVGGPGPRVYQASNYNLNYTHFGDADAAAGVPQALPTAPNTPNAPNTPGHAPAPRIAGQPQAAAVTDPFAAGRIVRLPTRNPVHHLAASADGKILITAEDQVVRIWDCSGVYPGDVEELDSQSMHLGNIRAIALSPNNAMLAIGGDDKSVRLYSMSNFELKKLDTQVSHDAGLWSVAFSPDGKSLISGADDQSIVCWNVSGGRLEEKSRTKIQSMFGVKYLAVQPGNVVTCATGTGDVRVIDFSSATPVEKSAYKIPPSPFMLPMAMSPKDATLLFGSGRNIVLKGASDRVYATGYKDIKCVAWSPDGKYFAVGTDDGHLLVLDLAGSIHYDYARPMRFNDVTFIATATPSAELLIAAANEDGDTYMLRFTPGKK